MRLLLVSGIFLNYQRAKADMILVVNNPSRAKLKSAIGYIGGGNRAGDPFCSYEWQGTPVSFEHDGQVLDGISRESHARDNRSPNSKRFCHGTPPNNIFLYGGISFSCSSASGLGVVAFLMYDKFI